MNFNITPIVRNLLIINFLVFFIDGFIFHLSNVFALRYIFASDFYPFQFVTYMFLHAGFTHVLLNMFALFMFGPSMELYWGSKKFLSFYFITGIGAAAFYTLINFIQLYEIQSVINAYLSDPSPDKLAMFEFAKIQYSEKANFSLVGASGATMGILMAFGMTFPQRELLIFPLPFPIKAWIIVTVYGLWELYSGIKVQSGDNVAHFAHIGGMVFAFIMIQLWKKRDNHYY